MSNNRVSVGDRIRQARLARGWSQSQLARIVGTSQQTVGRIELGNTDHSAVLHDLLRVLSIELSGDTIKLQEVPVVGIVGAGGAITPVDDHAQGGGLETTAVPAGLLGKDAVGVIVRGDSMEPILSDGDVLLYDKVLRGDLSPLYGRLVVARLVDGTTCVKKLVASSGQLVLQSLNGAPIVAPIEWAARVALIKKAG